MTVPGTPRHTGPSRYCGRDFTPAELDVIAGLAAALPSRAEISRAVCDALGWHAPGGRRKDMTARVALNRMAADHLITLPPPRHGNGNGRHPRHAARGGQLALPLAPVTTFSDLGPVTLTVVDGRQASRQWNQLIREHHYLGYTPLAGAQIRYLAAAPAAGPIAALAFAASAWKCAPRDTWIGWDPATRQANLNLICGNARFLIHPDITVPNLASWLLAAVTRRAARRLAGPLRLRPGPGRDLRRDRPVHRRQLPRRQLDPRRPDQRQGQTRPPPRTRPAGQGHLPLPPAPALAADPHHPARSVTPHGITEYLRTGCPPIQRLLRFVAYSCKETY